MLYIQNTFYSLIGSLSMPFKAYTLFNSKTWVTSAPCCQRSLIAASKVPPVANTSSTMITLSPSEMSHLNQQQSYFLIQISSLPYSRPYWIPTHSPGSFPFFLKGQQGFPVFWERGTAKRNPRDQSMKILLNWIFCCSSLSRKRSVTRERILGSATIGKMSRKFTPGLGKFSYTLVTALIWATLGSFSIMICIKLQNCNKRKGFKITIYSGFFK